MSDIPVYLSTSDVGRMLGISRQAVSQAIKRGTLRTIAQRGPYPLVAPEAVEEWRKAVDTRNSKEVS